LLKGYLHVALRSQVVDLVRPRRSDQTVQVARIRQISIVEREVTSALVVGATLAQVLDTGAIESFEFSRDGGGFN